MNSIKIKPDVVEYNPISPLFLFHGTESFIMHGINGAFRKLIDAAVENARKSGDTKGIIKINIPDWALKSLRFIFTDGRFSNSVDIYIAYEANVIREIMSRPEDFDKGGVVAPMGDVMGGNNSVVAAMKDPEGKPEWAPLNKPLEDNIRRHYKEQKQRLYRYFYELFPDINLEYQLTTRDIKAMMFGLICKLFVPEFNTSLEELRNRKIPEFESLISKTSQILFDTIFANYEFTQNRVNSENAQLVHAEFNKFYEMIAQARKPEVRGLLDEIERDYNGDKGKMQSAVIAMLEAGSKTLAHSIARSMAILATNPELKRTFTEIENRNQPLTRLVSEAVRGEPPVDLTFRQVKKRDQILAGNGLLINRDSIIILSIKDPLIDTYWDNNDNYINDPEDRRILAWLDRDKYDRGCLGIGYTKAIASAFIEYLLKNFSNFELVENNGVTIDATQQRHLRFKLNNEEQVEQDPLGVPNVTDPRISKFVLQDFES